jgi:peptidoglycan/LPS O-acetylase OafA/YrhL
VSVSPDRLLHDTHRYRPDIDGLRAVAVLSVLAFHLFPGAARGGFIGVDLFFVISGFLISSILIGDLEQGRPRFLRFYSRRVRRIFPSLLVVLFASWAAGWLFLLTNEYTQLGKHIAGGAGFIANLLYWGEAGYFDSDAGTKPLLHLWSLGVEEQFYLLWPLLLFVIWRMKRFRGRLLLALLSASFALNLATVYRDATAAFYSPFDRFWELLAGAALAYAGTNARATEWWSTKTVAHELSAAAGLALVAIAILRIDRAAVFPGWKALIPVAGAGLVIAAGADAWINRRLLSHRAVVWIGLISYPLYLWHWPLLSFSRIVTSEPSTMTRVAIAFASIVLAALTYWIVELPIRARPPGPRMVMALSVLMLIAGGLGLNTFWRRGHPQRLPAIVQQLADFSYDDTRAYRVHECLLLPDEHEHVLGPNCLDSDPARLSLAEVALWGDSHAAHLYPGLTSIHHDAFRISQVTAAACAPLFDVPGRWESCGDLNAAAFAVIAARKPAIVILGAQWSNYEWSVLPKTIGRLKAAGIGKVVVVGPVPLWENAFPTILARAVLKDRPQFRIPERMTTGFGQDTIEIDRGMRALARNAGAAYESPLAILCNQDGCLTHAGDGDEVQGIITFDTGHLTPAGSRYVVSRFTHVE